MWWLEETEYKESNLMDMRKRGSANVGGLIQSEAWEIDRK